MKGDFIGAFGTYKKDERVTKSVLLENLKNKDCM